MKMWSALVALGLVQVASAVPVQAQQMSKGYVQGMFGVAQSVESDSIYAGLGAWRLNDRFDLFGEIGRLRNALGEELHEAAESAEERIRLNNEVIFHEEFATAFEVRVPAWYGFGGVRVRGPLAGRLSTFIEGGGGTARLDPQAHLTINGDNLDSEADAMLGLGDNRQEIGFVAGGGGGIAVRAWSHLRIEAGYRYMRIFGDAKTNINRFHIGGGWVF
jgi:hypothetical protein